MQRLVLLLMSLGLVIAIPWDEPSELDDYVQSDDGYFSWYTIAEYNYSGVNVYILNMTSQKWQDETFCDHPIWWHIMGIAIPDTLKHYDAGVLIIEGGSNDDVTEPPPSIAIDNLIALNLAKDTGTVVGYIRQVPNQPIVFANDPSQRQRSEDTQIAWTWRTYLDDLNAPLSVIARMPMTKAAKRGLDTINEFSKTKNPLLDITRFGVTGASKRGWTTWSLGATDKRVIAIMPLVFSMLNVQQTFMNHYRNLDGAWSFAFEPYYRENLTQEIYNPRYPDILVAEDLWLYKERMTMHKLSILSSGDEFFLSDESMHWWNDMPDPKYMLMLQNAEHIMAPHYLKIYETIASFWASVVDGGVLPFVEWNNFELETDGYIQFTTNPKPINITAWTATTHANDTRRDFRLFQGDSEGAQVHPVLWGEDLVVQDTGEFEYIVSAKKVPDEWVGFFFQGTWEGPIGYRMIFTSQNFVIPGTWPTEACTDAVSCYSVLV